MKERLADAIGPDARAIVSDFDDAAVQVLTTTAAELLRNGRDVIVEGFFQSDRYSETLASLTSRADSVLIHLLASDAELKHRYETRALEGQRHWIHGDTEKIGTLLPELPEYMAKMLNLTIPQIIVDTTERPLDINAIVQLIQESRVDDSHRNCA